MIPKLIFKPINDPDKMVDLINFFLLRPGKEFDWSGVYVKEYPEFGVLINKNKTQEDIKNTSEQFFKKLYETNKKEFEKIANIFQKEWDKNGEKFMVLLSEITEKEWPKDYIEIQAHISLNPICPRFLKQKTFDVYWRFSLEKAMKTSLHELLHFIWFEKWKDVFHEYNDKDFESPHLIWKLSEIVPLAILGDKRIQNIFQHTPVIYNEWKTKKIKERPLLDYFQEIYDKKTTFGDFMKKSWKFIKTHEKEINET